MEGGDESKRGARRRKWLRIFLLIFVLGYPAGWGAANLWLNSGGAKKKIGERVAGLIGAPLAVGTVSVTPFGTLRLRDLEIKGSQGEESGNAGPPAGDAGPPPLFAGEEIRVRLGLFSLLTKSIRVKSILVVGPVVSLVRGEDGGFLLPERPLAAEGRQAGPAAASASGVEERDDRSRENPSGGTAVGGAPPADSMGPAPAGIVVTDGAAPALPPEFAGAYQSAGPVEPGGAQPAGAPAAGGQDPAPGPAPGASGEAGPISTAQAARAAPAPPQPPAPDAPRPLIIGLGDRRFHFGDFLLREGAVHILSAGGEHVLLRVEDVEMRVAVGSDRRDDGRFRAGKAVLLETVEVESLEANVTLDGLVLNFSGFEASLAGGRIEGGFRTSPFFPSLPFLAEFRASGVSAPALSERVEADLGIDKGVFEGGFGMIGQLRVPESYQGSGTWRVEGAHVKKIGFLAPLSGAIDMKRLEDMEVDELSCRFSIGGGNVRIDDMRVSSPEIVMSARGFLSFQGAVSFASRLYVSERSYEFIRMIEARLPEGISLGYRPFGNGERFYRDYLIQGDARNPVINFWSPAHGVPVRQLREQIGQVLSAGRGAVGESK